MAAPCQPTTSTTACDAEADAAVESAAAASLGAAPAEMAIVVAAVDSKPVTTTTMTTTKAKAKVTPPATNVNFQLRLPGGKCCNIDLHDMAFDALGDKMDRVQTLPCHPCDTLEKVPKEWEGVDSEKAWCRTAIYRHHPLMVNIIELEEDNGPNDAPMPQLGTWMDDLHKLRPSVTANEFTRAMTAAVAAPRSDIFENLPRVTANVGFPKVRRDIRDRKAVKGRHTTQLVRVVPVYLLPFLCVFYDGHDLIEFTASIDALGAQLHGVAKNKWWWRTYAQYLANAATARNLNAAHVASQVSLARNEAVVSTKALNAKITVMAEDMLALREEIKTLRSEQSLVVNATRAEQEISTEASRATFAELGKDFGATLVATRRTWVATNIATMPANGSSSSSNNTTPARASAVAASATAQVTPLDSVDYFTNVQLELARARMKSKASKRKASPRKTKRRKVDE